MRFLATHIVGIRAAGGRWPAVRLVHSSAKTGQVRQTTVTPLRGGEDGLGAEPIVNPASRPYARHRPELPQPRSYKLPMFLLLAFSAITWSAFTAHATNRERLSSSVLKNVVDKIHESPQARRALGEEIHLKRETWLAGDPWIRGSVNMMQGRVDMSFKVVGSKESGTVYFSAIRRDAQTPYETLRFLIVRDSDKDVVSLLD